MLDDKSFGARKAAREAEKLVSEIDARIPRLKVEITGPQPGAAITSLDGEIVDTTNAMLIDPGKHELLVEAEGFDPVRRPLHADEMSQETVTITMYPAGTTPEEEDTAAKSNKKKSGGINPLIPAGAAFGVGAVGLGLGITFGILAINEANKAKEFCNGNICPDNPEVKHARDLSITNGNVSTAMFVVGGAGVAAGVVLLLVLPSNKKKKDEAKEEAAIVPWIGANQIGIAGRF